VLSSAGLWRGHEDDGGSTRSGGTGRYNHQGSEESS
jgi:hypothetical protein